MSELAQGLSWGRDESELVNSLQSGSESAFDWLVTYYHASVYNLIYGIISDPADAADITQEVFIQAFRGIRGFRGGSSLKTWLYRISVRQALNHRRWFWRHHRHQVSIDTEESETSHTLELQDMEATPFEQCATHEMQATVRRGLAAIPTLFRSAVILRDLEGLAYEEVAEVLEVSVGTVKSRIFRGRRMLKDVLDPMLHGQTEASRSEVRSAKQLQRAAAPCQTTGSWMMNCAEAARYLPGYLDSALDSRQHASLRQHLASCDDCKHALDGYRRMGNFLAAVEPTMPAADLAIRIRVQASQLNSAWFNLGALLRADGLSLRIFWSRSRCLQREDC